MMFSRFDKWVRYVDMNAGESVWVEKPVENEWRTLTFNLNNIRVIFVFFFVLLVAARYKSQINLHI